MATQVLWSRRWRRTLLRDLLGQREADPFVRYLYTGRVRGHLVLTTLVVPTARFLGSHVGNCGGRYVNVEATTIADVYGVVKWLRTLQRLCRHRHQLERPVISSRSPYSMGGSGGHFNF